MAPGFALRNIHLHCSAHDSGEKDAMESSAPTEETKLSKVLSSKPKSCLLTLQSPAKANCRMPNVYFALMLRKDLCWHLHARTAPHNFTHTFEGDYEPIRCWQSCTRKGAGIAQSRHQQKPRERLELCLRGEASRHICWGLASTPDLDRVHEPLIRHRAVKVSLQEFQVPHEIFIGHDVGLTDSL